MTREELAARNDKDLREEIDDVRKRDEHDGRPVKLVATSILDNITNAAERSLDMREALALLQEWIDHEPCSDGCGMSLHANTRALLARAKR